MQLTDKIKAEIDGITKQTHGIKPIMSLLRKEIMKGRSINRKYIVENAKQLSSHKVRLENFLCETDLKAQVH